jgi:integrase
MFKGPSFSSIHEARANVQSFLDQTELEIRRAKGEQVTPEELMLEAVQKEPSLIKEFGTYGLVESVAPRLDAYLDNQGTPNPEFERLYSTAQAIGKGELQRLLTFDGLLEARRLDREPAPRTFEGWVKALQAFMEFNRHSRPGAATRADAVAYKDHLIARMSRNSAKTQLAYCAGLWTTLIEKQGGGEHIFKGLPGTLEETTKTKALRAAQAKRNQSFEPTTPIDQWDGTIYLPVLKLLYFTGCRLAEVSALRGQDIHEDYISVEWQEERSLKTANSVRDIPLHPSLIKLVEPLRKAEGHIWPRLKTTSTIRGVEVIRWGGNLSKPCKNMTGLRPKDFRDRFATQLREHDFNQVNIERVMGHSALDTNSTYGGRNWDKYVQMINSIS